MEEKFNKIKYNQQYNKEHYKQFKTELKAEEKEELDRLLKENNLTKVEFIKKAKELLERGKLIMKKQEINDIAENKNLNEDVKN